MRVSSRDAGTRAPSRDAHWSVHFVWVQMKLTKITQADFLRKAGFPRTTFQRWWSGGTCPRVIEIEACLNVFGYTLKVAPITDVPQKRKRGLSLPRSVPIIED